MPDSITTDKFREIYDGNNSSVTEYPITLQWADDDDLHLIVGGVETGAFTVTPTGFTTTTPVPSGTQVVLYRATPRTQILPFANNTTPSPVDVKAALNKLTLMMQEVATGEESPVKSLTFPVTEDPSFLTQLPNAEDRLGTFFYCDAVTGELTLVGGETLTDILGEEFRGLQGIQGIQGEQGDPYATNITTKTASFALALTDTAAYIRLNSTSTITITIAPTGTGGGQIPWAVGAEIYFRRANTGSVALSFTGVTINNSSLLSTVGVGQLFCLKHLGSSVWDFI